jgi:hypothetical protein
MTAPAWPETVTVTPGGYEWDDDGNRVPAGTPTTLTPRAIAPGATALAYEAAGELDTVEYTIYLDLGAPIADDDAVTVRGKLCWARVREWRSPFTGRGGLEVLCRSATGASA